MTYPDKRLQLRTHKNGTIVSFEPWIEVVSGEKLVWKLYIDLPLYKVGPIVKTTNLKNQVQI